MSSSGLLLQVALMLTLLVAGANSASPADTLGDYTVETWRQRDGVPPGTIWSLAQDSRGYLWLGTDAGLLRFDGFRFEPWDTIGVAPLPRGRIMELHISRNDDLWIGYRAPGGVSVIRNGVPRSYGYDDGLPETAVNVLLDTADDRIWTGTPSGLYYLEGDRWRQWRGHGLPEGSISGGYVDREGRLVLSTPSGLYVRGRNESTFTPAESFISSTRRGDLPVVCETPGGVRYVTDWVRGFMVAGIGATVQSQRQGRGQQILCDRAGNLWIGTVGEGLWRVAAADTQQNTVPSRIAQATGLTGEGVFSLLEDRDGNIWAGTIDGLNRLTQHRVTQVTDLGIVVVTQPASNGSMWAGTFDGLVEFRLDAGKWRQRRRMLSGSRVRAMHTDATALWVSTDRGLVRIVDGRIMPVRGSERFVQIEAIASDRTGRLWLADTNHGLLRYEHQRFERVALPPDVPQGRIGSLHVDRRGNVWVGFRRGPVGVIDRAGQFRLHSGGHPLGLGSHWIFYEGSDESLWFGNNRGLTRLAGHFSTAYVAEELKAILEDEAQQLWVATNLGVVRISGDEFTRAVANSIDTLNYTAFDTAEGMAGSPQWSGGGSGSLAPDGTLWFVTGQGITIINPQFPSRPPLRADPQINAVVVDSRRLSLANAELSSTARTFEFDYSIVNLSSPNKTRFRYRLDGFDSDWVDAGNRRQAFYTNLSPGQYRFRVLASDEGDWTQSGEAVWSFAIEPRFYQTVWFALLCATGGVLLIWGAWWLRLRQIHQRFALLLDERARVSRDLHDTLLQGLVGVAIQLESASDDVDAPAATRREQFQRLRQQIERYIIEARESIWNLRSTARADRDLTTMLGEQIPDVHRSIVHVVMTGRPRRYPVEVEEQLALIAREAIANALNHGSPTGVVVDLEYSGAALTLRISDDGRGFDLETVAADGMRYGLIGMRERAERAGGTLSVQTRAGQGTRIEVVIPHVARRQRAIA